MDPIDSLKEKFADQVLGESEHAGQRCLHVRRDRVLDILRTLRDELHFDYLADVTALDYLNAGMPERFCVVYNLYSFKTRERTRLKAFVPENDPSIDSASELWKAAPWGEREVYDLYGISFRNHPDLKRILLPDSYTGHPLRKDYPLQGRGERSNFEKYVP